MDSEFERLESPQAAERAAAQHWLLQNLRIEDELRLRRAIERGGEETRRRLEIVLSEREDFFPALLTWLDLGPKESQIAQSALWEMLRRSGRWGSENSSNRAVLSESLFIKHWAILPQKPYLALRFVDLLLRFQISSRPILLDPALASLWEQWEMNSGESGFAGEVFQQALERLRATSSSPVQLGIRPRFFWCSAQSGTFSDQDIFLQLLKSWRSKSISERKIARWNLNQFGFEPVQKLLIEEFVSGQDFWEEALYGLCTPGSVTPGLQERRSVAKLIEAFEKLPQQRREIAHVLVLIGRKDSEGNSLEPIYRVASEQMSQETRTQFAVLLERLWSLGKLEVQEKSKNEAPFEEMLETGAFPESKLEEMRILLSEEVAKSNSPFPPASLSTLARIADSEIREKMLDWILDPARDLRWRVACFEEVKNSFEWLMPRQRGQEINKAQKRLEQVPERDKALFDAVREWIQSPPLFPLPGENLLARDEFADF